MTRSLGLVLALVLAGGCFVKKSTHQKALAEIKDLQGQLSTSQGKLDDDDKHITQLSGDLSKAQADLQTLTSGKQLSDEEVTKIRTEKEATEKELADLQAKRDADQKRLAAYQDLQKRFKSLVDSGALEIAYRRGQMTLKLPSGVLFPSGSADLSTDGQTTLGKVTQVLLAFKDRRFLVAGHTDNVPINTKKFKNNWYLSTARAVSVLEYMVTQGFPAEMLAAAGYADKDPVGDNTTDAGREQNRRIEIVLVPDLSELPDLAQEPQ